MAITSVSKPNLALANRQITAPITEPNSAGDNQGTVTDRPIAAATYQHS
uniref:Uncharacterized protein n=1 Tax=Rheinheimera sp. BAL341 TaxID=1708203 RepID=A0A486XN31_9GAMM